MSTSIQYAESNITKPCEVKVGTKIRYIPGRFGHSASGITPGEVYTVAEVVERPRGGASYVLEEANHRGSYGFEWFNLVELPQEDSVPSRPTIDFSGSGGLTGTDRSTARAYAADLISRVNKATTNAVLDQVSSGSKAVDAYALAEAVLDATRGSLTRFGQSTARRRAGEKAAHLGYIAHAVLANHADALPVYADGERSRKVETLEGEIAALQAAGTEIIEARDAARQDAAVLRREVESLKSSLSHVQTERLHGARVLVYAREMLSDRQRSKIEGFSSGLIAGRESDWDL